MVDAVMSNLALGFFGVSGAWGFGVLGVWGKFWGLGVLGFGGLGVFRARGLGFRV